MRPSPRRGTLLDATFSVTLGHSFLKESLLLRILRGDPQPPLSFFLFDQIAPLTSSGLAKLDLLSLSRGLCEFRHFFFFPGRRVSHADERFPPLSGPFRRSVLIVVTCHRPSALVLFSRRFPSFSMLQNPSWRPPDLFGDEERHFFPNPLRKELHFPASPLRRPGGEHAALLIWSPWC